MRDCPFGRPQFKLFGDHAMGHHVHHVHIEPKRDDQEHVIFADIDPVLAARRVSQHLSYVIICWHDKFALANEVAHREGRRAEECHRQIGALRLKAIGPGEFHRALHANCRERIQTTPSQCERLKESVFAHNVIVVFRDLWP